MKRLLLLFVCLAALKAGAQKKLTEKDLQGKWSLVAMKVAEGMVDLKTEKFTPDADMVKELNMSETEIEEMGIALIEEMGYSNEVYVHFSKGNHLETNIDGGWEFDFELEERNGKYFVVHDEIEFEVYIKNRQLYFVFPDLEEENSNFFMIYEK